MKSKKIIEKKIKKTLNLFTISPSFVDAANKWQVFWGHVHVNVQLRVGSYLVVHFTIMWRKEKTTHTQKIMLIDVH